MPLVLIFEDLALPHSPKGFLPINLERANQRLAISSFLYLSETSLTCSRNFSIMSDSNKIPSTDKVAYNCRREAWIFFESSLSTDHLCLNSKSSFSLVKSSPTKSKK